MQNSKTKILVEGAMMLALGIVLSLITPFQRLLPFGGSITLVSMLPICLFSIKYGISKGLCVSLAYALYQFAQGAIRDGLFAWGLTPGMLIACILFDYVIAFTVLGLAGAFRKKGLGGWICGIIMVMCLRFLSHFISGVYVFASTGKIWDELNFVADNKYIYSFVYNGSYMLPELIFTTLAAIALLKVPQTRKLLLTDEMNQ